MQAAEGGPLSGCCVFSSSPHAVIVRWDLVLATPRFTWYLSPWHVGAAFLGEAQGVSSLPGWLGTKTSVLGRCSRAGVAAGPPVSLWSIWLWGNLLEVLMQLLVNVFEVLFSLSAR